MSRHIASLVITTAFVLSASATAHAQAGDGDKTFFDFQVEQTVRVKTVRAPEFPDRLRAMGKEQQVLVQFVVDERGQAQMNTFKVIKSTDGELTESVRRAISTSSFFPAEYQGHKVKQLVQQPFTFKP